MLKNRSLALTVLCVIVVGLTGCTKNLSTGRNFTDLQNAPEGKAVIYFVRDDNFMATKWPYAFISASHIQPDEAVIPAKERFVNVAVVGRDMFVPVFADPGDYYFRNTGSTEKVTIKAGEVACFDVGSKFRGITLFVVERITSLEECRKLLLAGAMEGVQLLEAHKRLGIQLAQGITPELAQSQILLQHK